MRGVGACMRGVVACPNGQAAHDCAALAACLLAGWRVQPLGRLYGPARRASRSDPTGIRGATSPRGVRSVSESDCGHGNSVSPQIINYEVYLGLDGRMKPLRTLTSLEASDYSNILVARVRTGPRAALVHLLRIRRMRDRRARAPRRPRTAPRRRSRGRAAPPPPPQPRGC